jgi:hypothetical protein
VLCNLTAIQTSGDASEYVHGWDLLLSLLQDTNHDKERLAEDDRRKSRIPFPIANETQVAKNKAPCRFTSWMRELMFILDKYIEPISFLAGALDFRFESAYRQLRVSHEKGAPPNLERDGGSVMVDEGVVEYLVGTFFGPWIKSTSSWKTNSIYTDNPFASDLYRHQQSTHLL